MVYNPEIHHRRSIRVPGYDYSKEGACFITICCEKRVCLFGEIQEEEMHLNACGEMIKKRFLELPNKFPSIMVDTYVVMPNHFHCIITIDTDIPVGEPCLCVICIVNDQKIVGNT